MDSNTAIMKKKPTKLPPPPPLPPPPLPPATHRQRNLQSSIVVQQSSCNLQLLSSRQSCRSPARSCCSFSRPYVSGCGSEFGGADSVYSMPVPSTFSPMMVRSPSSYHISSCISESAQSVRSLKSACCQSCCPSCHNCGYSSNTTMPANIVNHSVCCCETSSFYSTCSQPVCHGSTHQIVNVLPPQPPPPMSHTTPSINGSSQNHMTHYPDQNSINYNTTNNNNIINNNNSSSIDNNNLNYLNMPSINMNHENVNGSNAIQNINYNQNGNHNNSSLKPKIPRPVLTISPIPTLKIDSKVNKTVARSHLKCKPLLYKRHIERHIDRLSKYLKERKQRRLKRLADIGDKNKNCETLLSVLETQETQYLRSLRSPITKNDFIELERLGSGFIGNVCLVEKKPNKFNDSVPSEREIFAMKKLKKSQVLEQNHIAHIMAERDILAEADNDWIVKLYYSFQDSHSLYFILEFVPGGDMMYLLSLKNVFPESWAKFYIAEIALAVQFVHSMGFVHRDIKPDNILIDKNGHIKLTDFGLCTGFRYTHDSSYYRDDTINSTTDHDQDYPTITNVLTAKKKEYSKRKRALSLVGSPNYIAPEVLRRAFTMSHGNIQDGIVQESTNEKLCDWWSVGVILYEMVIGYCPFIDLEKLRMGNYYVNDDPPYNIQDRIMNWRKHLKFPARNDPLSPPLQSEKILPDKYFRPSDLHKGSFDQPKYITQATEDLIRRLLCDPSGRLCQKSVDEMKPHPFFDGLDWDNIRQTEAPCIPYLINDADTSHFQFEQANHQLSEPDEQISTGTLTNNLVNDFTYKNFCQK